MRMVIQRVTESAVAVDGRELGRIGPGLLALVGFAKGDTESQIPPAIEKMLNLRIFSDDQGRFMHSARDITGGILAVPQFTLFADSSKGRRPEFFGALEPGPAKSYFDKFVESLRAAHSGVVASGEFGAHMTVSLINDGPVTIILDDRASGT